MSMTTCHIDARLVELLQLSLADRVSIIECGVKFVSSDTQDGLDEGTVCEKHENTSNASTLSRGTSNHDESTLANEGQ